MVVIPAAAASLSLSGSGSPTAGVPFPVTVTVLDAFGNVATSYTGRVHFTSTDPLASLPADYTFTPGDGGIHAFSVTLDTSGSQSITATDTGNSALSGTAIVSVVPGCDACDVTRLWTKEGRSS